MKKICKFVIVFLILILDLGLFITVFKNHELNQLGAIITLPLSLALSSIVSKIFKISFSDDFKIIYYIFIFLAQFLGSCCQFYDTISWYDNFTHFLSGMFSGYLAIYLLNLFHFKSSKTFNCLFILGITALIAIAWEFIEFGIDNLFNMNMQHSLDTGVNDTMFDILFAFLGSLFFNILYSLKK